MAASLSVIPASSPDFLRQNPVEDARDISAVPLLHLASRPDAWKDWFAFNDISLTRNHGMVFEQFSIVIQAAVAGIGMALLPTFHIQNELDCRELVAIQGIPLQSSRSAYYLVTPIDRSDYAPVEAFRNWLVQTIQSEQN